MVSLISGGFLILTTVVADAIEFKLMTGQIKASRVDGFGERTDHRALYTHFLNAKTIFADQKLGYFVLVVAGDV